MTLVPTNPIVINGETYDLYTASLAIASNYVNGSLDANAAMRLIPTRIDSEGNTITAEDNSVPLTLGSVDALEAPEAKAMLSIYTAIQTYIFEKGL